MAKKKVTEIETEEKAEELVDNKKVLQDKVEELFEVLREQEDKIQRLYDLESSLKVMAVAVGAIASEYSDSSEELFREARELKWDVNGEIKY